MQNLTKPSGDSFTHQRWERCHNQGDTMPPPGAGVGGDKAATQKLWNKIFTKIIYGIVKSHSILKTAHNSATQRIKITHLKCRKLNVIQLSNK